VASGGVAGEWSLVGVADVVADAVPDREMLVCGDVRRTFAQVRDRSRSLAAFLASRGIGAHRERVDLERWELGQDPVALVLHNCAEYIESMLGAFRARAVLFNVNQHYRPGELGALLAAMGIRAVVLHRRYGPLVAEACARAGIDPAGLVVVELDDGAAGSQEASLPGATPYEEAVATAVVAPASLPGPTPEDTYLVCTGGTTGRPKGVLWRQADVYVSAMGGGEDATVESIRAATASTGGPWFAMPPLMHAASQWTAFAALHGGSTVLLHDDSRPFDAASVLRLAESEGASMISMVGDAHVGPMVEELGRNRYDLSAMGMVAVGGAATSEHHKAALLERLPGVVVVDGYGSSETGGMAYGARSADRAPAGFSPAAGATVLSADRSRVLEPGEDEVGWTARRGRVPLGYLGDREATEATFPIVGGERLAVPGDRARRLADGSIVMLGRDSMVVNTGGEKVFVEEVEAVILTHPDVADVLVVGRPSPRFGEEVVAVVAPRPGATLDPVSVRRLVASRIARFKAPRAVAVCDEVVRHASGKADYRWARRAAELAVDVTAG
jgi:fatty-acyl-CoA synthase